MGENLKIVGPGKTREYPYPECKKNIANYSHHWISQNYLYLMVHFLVPENYFEIAVV